MLAVVAVVGFAIVECAKTRTMVTFMERNWVAIREIGESPIGLIGDPPPGQTINGLDVKEWVIKMDGHELADVSHVQDKKWWEKLGLYVIGWPWHSLKMFDMIHERMSKNIDKIKEPEKWIERDTESKPTWYLECNPTHEYLIMEIELSEGWVINALAQVELVLLHPLIAAYERKGKFYPVIGQSVRAGLNDAIKGEDYKDFQKLEKDAESKLSRKLCADINKSLPALSGYKARRILFPKWDPIDPQRDKLNEEATAKIEANVKKLKAEAENAEFDKAMEIAKKRAPTASDSELLATVTDMLNKKRIAESNLTVYAEGGSHMAISTPPPQKKGPKK